MPMRAWHPQPAHHVVSALRSLLPLWAVGRVRTPYCMYVAATRPPRSGRRLVGSTASPFAAATTMHARPPAGATGGSCMSDRGMAAGAFGLIFVYLGRRTS